MLIMSKVDLYRVYDSKRGRMERSEVYVHQEGAQAFCDWWNNLTPEDVQMTEDAKPHYEVIRIDDV